MRSFPLTVLTPLGTFFDGEIEALTLVTSEGEIGIMAGRESAVIAVEKGVIRYVKNGETVYLSEDGGVFEMKGGKGVLLCSAVYDRKTEAEDRVKRAQALEKERERQKQSLSEYKLGQASLAKAFDKLKRARHNIK